MNQTAELELEATTEKPKPTTALQPMSMAIPVQSEHTAMISMIERAARDPSVDIEKLERLIALQEKAELRRAEQAFSTAMSEAQSEMRAVAADSNNPQTRSRYASYFALDKALRPIYSSHGFALSFDTGECALEQYVRVLCHVSHQGGFTRTYHVDMPADGKGAKGGDVMTKTHAVGSGLTYGQRYLLKLIFNIAVGTDDDGNAATEKGGPVTQEQTKRLLDLIAEVGADTQKFCGVFQIEGVALLPSSRYEEAVTRLKQFGAKSGEK